MWREYRIIDGLWPTAVPVAEPIALGDDRAVCETHFYVMGKVEGDALYSGEVVSAWLDESARRRAGEMFVDVLAALHSINPADVGLAELGRPDGYVARQLKTWYGSWNASIEYARHDEPRVHELHDLLSSRIPEQGPGRVVHGDYGPHNSLFSQSGEVLAVLDWEIATLGDPLADFAYSLNAWTEPGDPGVFGSDPPTVLPGFPSRNELTERYAEATGADMSQLAFYRSFNVFDGLHPARGVRPIPGRPEEHGGCRPPDVVRSDRPVTRHRRRLGGRSEVAVMSLSCAPVDLQPGDRQHPRARRSTDRRRPRRCRHGRSHHNRGDELR